MDIFKKIKETINDSVQKMTRDDEVKTWLNDLEDAGKREKHWRDQAQRVTEIYEQARKSSDAEGGGNAAFNILYANTETLSPAVYNNVPRPVVKRKVDKQNPIAIAAAQVLQNTLVYLTDTADSNYSTFDELLKFGVLGALVPGRGGARFDYDAEFMEVPPTPEELQLNPEAKPSKRVKSETICGDAIGWNRVLYGYADRWHKVPWLAYEHFMTREECEANFGEEKGSKIVLTHAPTEDTDKQDKSPADAQGCKFAHIYEIWNKADRKVLFVSPGFGKIIETRDDPLKLEAFFNSPRPISFLGKLSSLVPQCLYLMYEEQAKELEDITVRIGKLTRAMKVRGFYDGTLQGLDQLLSKPDNTLLPAENVAAMQQGQTLEKAIWLMPLEKLIAVLQQLYLNRTQVIGVIHQLTGVADVMRGASAASETLGAQKMKEAWGTMRLKRMQKEVQRFTKDSLRLQAELAAKHFHLETFKQMTGMKLPMAAEKQEAQMKAQQLQAQMQPQMDPATGQQIPPNPQAAQQAQQQIGQLQGVLSQPSWEEVVDFIKNDKLRNYVIDIETNSTVDIEATEDKEELAEMMNSMSQLMNGVFPMVKEGVLPFEPAKQLMLAVISKFRLGDDVEATFRAMREPLAKEDPKVAADKAKLEQESAQSKAEHEMDMASRQQDLAQKKEIANLELQVKQEELRIQREELALKEQFMRAKHELDMQTLVAKATMPPAAPAAPAGGSDASS